MLSDQVPPGEKADAENELMPGKQYALKEYLQDTLPKFCTNFGCLKLSRRDLDFIKARQKLEEELDLIKLLQRLRFFERALEQIMPNERLHFLKETSARLPLNKP